MFKYVCPWCGEVVYYEDETEIVLDEQGNEVRVCTACAQKAPTAGVFANGVTFSVV